ncbi:Uncharacterised protein [Halioglobus japonicus]|nr:Uncharacterised protein [Halioglobus japonicus]
MNSSVMLKVRVIPGASRSNVAGWLGDMLKVRVSAPPERGKANIAVIKLLARELQLQKSALSIASGSTSQNKVVAIQGITMKGIEDVFGANNAQ